MFLDTVISEPVLELSLPRGLHTTTPLPKLQLETHIVEHCDLNCQMCTHFSPLARPEFAKLDSFTCDMQRLRELFRDDLLYIMLLGGEPLLHPELPAFFDAARTCFPHTDIILYTNGLRLSRMDEGFWNSSRKNRISFTLTRYPVQADYETIDSLLSRQEINYQYCNTAGRSKRSSHFPLDLDGKQDPQKSFSRCSMANRCIFLRDGKLYTCCLIPNIQHFNQFFSTNLSVAPADSIDIYGTVDKNEILRFLATPPPFCRYCNVDQRTIGHVWARSTRSIEEWT